MFSFVNLSRIRPPAHPVVFDGNVLERLLAKLMDGHVTYTLGAKCGHASSTDPEDIRSLDCSGLVEYVFYKITNPHVDIPSGSSNQEDWFRRLLLSPRDDPAAAVSVTSPPAGWSLRIGEFVSW
jgi:hypothetical protein